MYHIQDMECKEFLYWPSSTQWKDWTEKHLPTNMHSHSPPIYFHNFLFASRFLSSVWWMKLDSGKNYYFHQSYVNIWTEWNALFLSSFLSLLACIYYSFKEPLCMHTNSRGLLITLFLQCQKSLMTGMKLCFQF